MFTPGKRKPSAVVTCEQERWESERVRRSLGPYCDAASIGVVMNYLATNDVSELHPILILNYLPALSGLAAAGIPGTPGPATVAGIQTAITAALLAQTGVVDIANAGSVFLFPSHDALNVAKARLSNRNLPGNIWWAFDLSPFGLDYVNTTLAANGVPAAVAAAAAVNPKYISTRMISYYNREDDHFQHDYYEFFSA